MKILYFASIRDALETSEETLSEVPSSSTIHDILEMLIQRGEPWASTLSNQTLLTALNQELVSADTAVNDNDELAIMPPVTGG